MKKLIKISIFLFWIGFVQAELLVIKQHGHRWVSLDNNDEGNKEAIAAIFLKYQWPMVIDSDLTDQEADELLRSDQPYAEERFIAKKLKEIDPSYDLIFIPTSLYEIFMIGIINNESQFGKFQDNFIDLRPILAQTDNQDRILQNIYDRFDQVNNRFYPDIFFTVNKHLTTWLFHELRNLAMMPTSSFCSREIEYRSGEIAAALIYRLDLENSKKVRPDRFQLNLLTELIVEDVDMDTIRYDGTLFAVITLEYQARLMNKGLLLRGSSKLSVNIVDPLIEQQSERLPIATTTLRLYQHLQNQDVDETKKDMITDLPQSFMENSLQHYSISFGNSLFAGMFYDQSACSYFFILGYRNGFGIFIDKEDYYKHEDFSLFFIPPLATISGLVSSGEWFHPRSKSAGSVLVDKNEEAITRGIANSFKDPIQLIRTNKNPLDHAIEYSSSIAKNFKMIQPTSQPISQVKNNSYIYLNKIHSQSVVQNFMDTKTEPMAINQAMMAGYLKNLQTAARRLPK